MTRLIRTMYFVLALTALAVSAAGTASASPDDDADLFGQRLISIEE